MSGAEPVAIAGIMGGLNSEIEDNTDSLLLEFWKVFDDRLDLCYRALMCRHNRLKGTLSDAHKEFSEKKNRSKR